jgi:tetratricopeptide (TPR) repeat protein
MKKVLFYFVVYFIGFPLMSQSNLVIVYRKINVGQQFLVAETFPLEDIKSANKESSLFIDEISHDGLKWNVVMSNLSYEGQTLTEDSSFPSDWINRKWSEGYYISNMDYGRGKWIVVMSKGAPFKGMTQAWFSTTDINQITVQVKKYWDNDFRIMGCSFGKGEYVFLMTKGSSIKRQTFKFSEEIPVDWIQEKYNEKFNISYVNNDGKYWIYVASTYDSQVAEKHRSTEGYDNEQMQSIFDEGYRIYRICFKHMDETESDYLTFMNRAMETDDNDLAVYYYTEALKIKPNDPTCLNNLAWSKFKLGQCQGAESEIDKALGIEERNFSLHTKGCILACQNRHHEAISYFDRAISLLTEEDEQGEYYFDRGRSKEQIGDISGAKLDYSKAISFEPENVDYLVKMELVKLKSDAPKITWDFPFHPRASSSESNYRIKLCVHSSLPIEGIKIFNNGSQVVTRGVSLDDACDYGVDQELKLNSGSNKIEVEFTCNGKTYTSDSRVITYNSERKNSNYHALLIAVQSYNDLAINDLANPISDSKLLKKTLIDNYTFDSTTVTLLENPTKETIVNSLISLQDELKLNDNLLIYFSGHGLLKNEVGYWLPSDAKMDNRSTWFSNGEFRDYINGIKSQHTLVIADACFSGSIFTGGFRDVALASCEEMAKVKSRRAMTSGANTVVPDESVFLKLLCNLLNSNQLSCITSEDLYARIKPSVISNSPNNQIPQFGILPQVGDEGGNFVFRKKL